MPLLDLYSYRRRRAAGDVPDVLTFDDIPRPLRVSITHIWARVFRVEQYDPVSEKGYELLLGVRDHLRIERGVFSLAGANLAPHPELVDYFLEERDVDQALDVIELIFGPGMSAWTSWTADHAVVEDARKEVNQRFQHHGLGYRLENTRIHRIDSEILHAQVTQPALRLLHADEHRGADDEFRSAHEHYRHGRFEEALTDACKAVESVLKTILGRREWPHNANGALRELVTAALQHDLFPPSLQDQFACLQNLLLGPAVLRNRNAAHGQGEEVRVVPGHLAAYGLHLAGSAIVLLVAADRNLD